MIILALDAATSTCSVALNINGTIVQENIIAPQQHANKLLSMLDTILKQHNIKQSQLDAIAFGRGPGSFTGVRIASSIAQALAFAHDLPVIPVSNLQALAQKAMRVFAAQFSIACLDARMKEVYIAAFEKDAAGIMQAITQEQVISAQHFKAPLSHEYHALGSGIDAYFQAFDTFNAKFHHQQYPEAHDIAFLAADAFNKGETLAPENALPVYLRNNVTD